MSNLTADEVKNYVEYLRADGSPWAQACAAMLASLWSDVEDLRAAKGYVQDIRVTGPNGEEVAAPCALDGCALMIRPEGRSSITTVELYGKPVAAPCAIEEYCQYGTLYSDAMRYRFLRDKAEPSDVETWWWSYQGQADPVPPATFDRIIDAAMNESGPQPEQK